MEDAPKVLGTYIGEPEVAERIVERIIDKVDDAQVLLNPFYEPNTRIKSASFDARVKQSAQSHLRGK